LKREWGELYRDKGILKKWYPIHEGQRDILNSTARFRAIISGVSAGKTTCGALDLSRKVAEKPNGKFLIIAPTFKILDSATLPTFFNTIADTSLQGKYKIAAREYHLPTGGIIYCRSGEHADSFEGLQIDGGVWLDEGGNVSIKVWHAIQRRTGFYKAPVLITTTPYANYSWLSAEFIERHKEGNPNYYVKQFASILNPSYDKDEFERARRELPEWKFRMFYMGEFVGALGLVYPELPRCYVDMPKDGLPDGRLYGGIDWGGGTATADPFSALVGLLDKDDVLWVFFERYVSGRQNDLLQNAGALRDWHQVLQKNTGQDVRLWHADASRPNSLSTFRKVAGLTVRKANNQAGAIASGIDLVTSRIRTGRLKIIKGTISGIIREQELYRYPTGDDEEAHGDVPRDKHNHAMDALRYLVMGIDRKRSTIISV